MNLWASFAKHLLNANPPACVVYSLSSGTNVHNPCKTTSSLHLYPPLFLRFPSSLDTICNVRFHLAYATPPSWILLEQRGVRLIHACLHRHYPCSMFPTSSLVYSSVPSAFMPVRPRPRVTVAFSHDFLLTLLVNICKCARLSIG